MNCHECTEQLLPLVEGLLDSSSVQTVEAHLAGCPACQAENEEINQLQNRLLRFAEVPAHAAIVQPVMARIFDEQVARTTRLVFYRRVRLIAAGALAATVLIGLTWTALYYGPTSASAAEVLARGVEAASNLKSIYIKCRMRTLPQDNFSYVDLKHDFVDVELWKQFGPSKWRIEKSGRVVTVDGHKTIMLIGQRVGIKLDKPTTEPFDTGWLHRLAAIDSMLSHELTAASIPSRHSEIVRKDAPDDPRHEMIVVHVDPQHDVDPYLKNKFISTSETRREYTFDRKTGRLEGARWYCKDNGKDVLALEVVEIKYDPLIEDSKFELDIPAGVVWSAELQRLPDNEKYEKMNPAEAARSFFDACSKSNWDEAAKFFSPLDDRMKQYLGGLTVVKLGEPFQAWPYPGWFVPYEIRLSNGGVKKFNLAVRNDNPVKRYIVDGGI
jgi:hypothetical protein